MLGLMYELKKKLERYLPVNLLGPGPRLVEYKYTVRAERRIIFKDPVRTAH